MMKKFQGPVHKDDNEKLFRKTGKRVLGVNKARESFRIGMENGKIGSWDNDSHLISEAKSNKLMHLKALQCENFFEFCGFSIGWQYYRDVERDYIAKQKYAVQHIFSDIYNGEVKDALSDTKN